MEISISEAIRIATEAVLDAGVMSDVEGASATASVVDGRPVWSVTLTSARQTANVVVDGVTGEVLELNVS
jgi:hypothetical protein